MATSNHERDRFASTRKARDAIGGASILRRAINLPGALVTMTLVLFALALVLLLSLRADDGNLLLGRLTLDNLAAVVGDPLYRLVILRSFVIAGLVTVATVVTAYPVAWFIAFHGGRHKRLLLLLVSLPFWTSYLLRVFAWRSSSPTTASSTARSSKPA